MSYLGIKTAYSFLESTIKIDDLMRVMKEKKHDYVILNDDRLHALLQFFNAAKKESLKMIVGQSFRVIHQDKHITIYVTVRNVIGYRQLLKLNEEMMKRSLALEDFITLQEGLSHTISIKDAWILQMYLEEDVSSVIDFISHFTQNFKHGYVTYNLDTPIHESLSEELFHHMKRNTSFVFEHQTHYLDPKDRIHYEDLMAIKGDKIDETDFSILPKNAMEKFSQKLHEMHASFLIEHSFEWSLPTFQMPSIPLEEGVDEKAYVRALAEVGLNKRLKQSDRLGAHETYLERLHKELDIIFKMGFEAYFLIVYDIVKYAKTHDIYVGPGRGSAAGSLVSYALGITDIDPIEYQLLFERFLNPERISMPDIDMDFPDDKRDQVISYAFERFGMDHVASINTYQSFALKSALRDIAKVMKIDPQRTQYLTKQIINNNIDSLDQEMIDLKRRAEAIIGLPRQTGTHPAGMIFSKERLADFIPMQEGPYTFYQTQFEASELESLGLLKIDFLGIRNLAIIAQTIDSIHSHQPFNIAQIPKNDEKTYQLLSEAKTDGIFQLESEGIRQVLKSLKPAHFEDLIALLALYRPGPMAFIQTYIERRHGKLFEPLHPLLKDILSNTYGIIVYQEQIMMIAQTFAGYSLAEADLLRRGISKKDESILLSEKENFIKGSIKQGHLKQDAEELYDLIVKFSDYGFNRSHSVAYALVAYQMAYLKVNYPAEFMISLLNSVIGDDLHTHQYMDELKSFGIQVLKPNINTSEKQYIQQGRDILAPLSIIKSLGYKTVDTILEVRKDIPFSSFDDFKKRMYKKINSNHIERLIDAGAFDMFEMNHQTLHHHSSMDMMDYALYVKDISYQTLEEFSYDELMRRENEALGFQMTYDIDAYLKTFKTASFHDVGDQHASWIAVQISQIKTIKTKQGEPMAFLKVTDGKESYDVTVFPKTFASQHDLKAKSFYKILVKKNIYNNKVSYIVNQIKNLDD